MRISVGLSGICLTLVFSTSTLAATVTSEQGEVLVNQGAGYKPVTQPTEVAPGDQVIAKPRSSGRVVFSDGCAVKVEPGSVLTITPQSPCEPRGSHVVTGGSLKDAPVVVEPTDHRRWLLPAAVVVAGVVTCVLLCDPDDDDKPASP